MRRLLPTALALALLLPAAHAHADGDPASDILTPIEMPALPAIAGVAPGGGGGGGVPAAVLFGAPVLLLALAVAGLSARMGRADAAAADPHVAP